MRGWQVPAYPMPEDLQTIIVQRIVVREDLSIDMSDKLLADIRSEVAYLNLLESPMPVEGQRASFTH